MTSTDDLAGVSLKGRAGIPPWRPSFSWTRQGAEATGYSAAMASGALL
jgi:hypothetical protein